MEKKVKNQKVRKKNGFFKTHRKRDVCPIKIRLLLWLLCSTHCTGKIAVSKNSPENGFWQSQDLLTEKMVLLRSQSGSLLAPVSIEGSMHSVKVYRETISAVKNDCFLLKAERKCYRMKLLLLSAKERNKKIKTQNGNGQCRQNVTILHWNIGSKFWPKKITEIEAVILQYRPDIFAISEANLHRDELNREISGYNMLLPKLSDTQEFSRLIVLVKDTIEVKVLDQLSDERVAAIWLKIGATGRKPMVLGCVYREHRFMRQDEPEFSASDAQQLKRWCIFVEKWKLAAKMGDCTVIGDINLDFLKWGNPNPRISKMVEKVKNEIEILGFQQIVDKFTRTWNEQPDSVLDHIWINRLEKVIYFRNITRTCSDHNLLVLSLRTKDRIDDRHEIVSRNRQKLNLEEYREKIAKIEWGDYYEIEDVDRLNEMFEEKVGKILNEVAPVHVTQKRKNYKKWVNPEVKEEMKDRDREREKARISGRNEDWKSYRQKRNKCVKSLLKSKNEFFSKLYEKIDEEKNTKNLYRLTHEILNRKSGTTPQQLVVEGKLIKKTQRNG